MAKTWYPVIDYMDCIECGTCTDMCTHGVYDKGKAPTPLVVNPIGCVDHCHGCGGRCPVGAITYVGEDTGWTPPNGQKQEEEACSCGCGCEDSEEESCGCGCGCDCGCGEEADEKKVTVEYLYLDLQTCDRCMGTDGVLDEVMSTLTPALCLAGYEVEYRKTEMATAELAEEYRFLSSPTVRVNGRDVCGQVKENACGCCGDISGTDVDCRVFTYNGEDYEVPPKEMLAEGILKAAFAGQDDGCSRVGYELPENLKAFYEGKGQKSACSCSCGCC